jgi:hypothetical protein
MKMKMNKEYFLKIDTQIKGRIYLAAKKAKILNTTFKAILTNEKIYPETTSETNKDDFALLVDLTVLPRKYREEYSLPDKRRTSYLNTKNKKGTHSFYFVNLYGFYEDEEEII